MLVVIGIILFAVFVLIGVLVRSGSRLVPSAADDRQHATRDVERITRSVVHQAPSIAILLPTARSGCACWVQVGLFMLVVVVQKIVQSGS